MKKKEFGESLFLVAYGCILLAFLFQISNLPNTYNIIYSVIRYLRIFGYVMCLIKILITDTFAVKNIVKILLIFLLVSIATLRSESLTIFTDVFLIVACKNVRLEKTIKLDLKIRFLFLIGIALVCLTNLIPDTLDYRNGILSRHSLGFAHPNRFALHIFMICIYYLYINYYKIKIRQIIMIFFLGFFTLFLSDGRTSCLGIFLVLIIAILNRYNLKRKKDSIIEKNIKIVSTLSVIFSISFSILAPVLYLLGIFKINSESTFGSRIYMSSQGIRNYGITLFGQKIDLVTSIMARLTGRVANGIDNAYIYILVNYGVIILLLFIALIVVALKYAIKRSDYAGVLCFLIIIAVGIMENQILNIESDLFLLYVGKALYDRKKYNVNNNESKMGNGYEYTANKR